jgi:hypothetical protein
MVDTKAVEVVVEEGDRLVWLSISSVSDRVRARCGRRVRNYIALDSKCSGSNLPPIREDRSTLPIENQSFVSSGEAFFIPAFSFPGFDSIPGVILAKHRPKFPTALRVLLAKPLLKQDR